MSNVWPRRSSSICAPCSTSTVYARTSAGLVPISAATATPTGVCARRMARSLSPTRTGFAEPARLRARGQGPSRSQPLLRLGGAPAAPALSSVGVEYDCSYQRRLLGGLRPFRKHPEIVEILTCYDDHCGVMTGATGISWRREGPGTGARTPLIYLLMAVSARRLSTATVGEVNVHWRSV